MLERARAEPSAVAMSVSAELISDYALRATLRIEGARERLDRGRAALWAAVVESRLATPVGRGENAAKLLRNDRVVRHLERLPNLEWAKPGTGTSVEITLEDGWRRSELTVVTFLQELETLRILAAAECGLADQA